MKEKIKTALSRAALLVRSIYLLPVILYRKFLSPLKISPSCRFTPTCSAYAVVAVREWGIIAGSLLALWRVIRCNPFSRGGDDPVPSRKEFFCRVKAFFRKKTEKNNLKNGKK